MVAVVAEDSRLYSPPQPDEIPTVDAVLKQVGRRVAGLDAQLRRLVLLLRRHMIAAATGSDDQPPNALVIGPASDQRCRSGQHADCGDYDLG